MQQLVNHPASEIHVKGISMPHYGGTQGEMLKLFLDKAWLFFKAKNIDYTHPDNCKHVLVMMVSNMRVQAAAWFDTQQAISQVSTTWWNLNVRKSNSTICRNDFGKSCCNSSRYRA
jgi:hypothetical protein